MSKNGSACLGRTTWVNAMLTFATRVFLLIATSALACEGGAGLVGSDPDPVELTVSPKTVTLEPDEEREFTAVGLRSNGDTAQITVTWSASGGTFTDTGSQGGLHYGRYKKATCGRSLVVATSHPASLADTATVTIVCVAAVNLSPASASVPVGGTVQLAAIAKDAQGNPLAGRAISWSSSNPAVATVSSSGLVTGVSAGSTPITATSEGASGTAALTVTSPPPVPVASVRVTPGSASIQVGATVQLSATPEDAQGNPLAGRAITWSSSTPAVATVSSSGLVTGVSAGSTPITATSEGTSGTSSITVTDPPPPPGDTVVLVGAGDIASCSSSGDDATAALINDIAGTVFTAGDNAYPDGTTADFGCYDASWGAFKARTRPSPGNHDYHVTDGADYFSYYGALAGPVGRGYYSHDLGDWHLISLNSNVPMSAGSAQEQWLRADLAASTAQCTLAYWHHPRFSSGTTHGSTSSAEPLWQALYDAGADLVISGHEHNYERFAPQTPTGAADAATGIRQFIVGTGGAGHYTGVRSPRLPNSEVFDGTTWGVLKLTLGPGTYSWQFIPVAGQTFTDSGTGQCH
jgi:uncharacterized protein YjdB